MKEVKLEKASRYYLEYKNKYYEFKKGDYHRLPDGLADKLLATGDFIEIIEDRDIVEAMKSYDISTPQVGGIVTTGPILVGKPDDEVTMPLTEFNKLEVATDLKKSKKRGRKKQS